MTTRLKVQLTPEIITDFTACFDKKQDERRFLYTTSMHKINETLGDILHTKIASYVTTENGIPKEHKFTLDELGYDNFKLPTDPDWKTDTIEGDLEDYEILLTDSSYLKIQNSHKLQYLVQNKVNESNNEKNITIMEERRNDPKITKQQLEKLEENFNKSLEIEKKAREQINVESLNFILFFRIIMDKINQTQKAEETKEFEALLKSEEAAENKKNNDNSDNNQKPE